MDLFDGAQVLARIGRCWWLVVTLVVLVAVGATLTNLPALTSPPYVESATFEIVAVTPGASSYGGIVARSVAQMAGEDIGSWLNASPGVDAALGTVEIANSGDEVAISAHSATKIGAERLLAAALAAINARVVSDAAEPGGSSRDVLARIVVTNAGSGAVVDKAVQGALWREIALRVLAAFGVALALVIAASLWSARRRRSVAGTGLAERTPAGENE